MAYGLLHDFLLGQTIEAYKYFGAHFTTLDNKKGVIFRLYAPLAKDVSIIGDFNNWNVAAHKMVKIDEAGVYELFIPGLVNYQNYKYHFCNAQNRYVDKADPFAFFAEVPPQSGSRLFDIDDFQWHDEKYMSKRTRTLNKPMSIYEMHLGSWKGLVNNRFLSYEETADYLIPYLQENGFTHIEIMPITQYPFDGSWGYQATGFFAVDSRYGNPMQLMSFIDRLHQAGIGVILDFVLVHFAIDSFGLIEFDGSKMYEYSAKENTYSQWGSAMFDLAKDPVRSFLMSAVDYFLSYFHFDGVRFDAIANVIYWHGDKTKGENSGAIEFVKRLTYNIHGKHPQVMLIAEDSSDYQGVTDQSGLGFDYKWDLGFMNDTIKYYGLDPVYRQFHHTLINFSMAYYYSEKFLLPFSHDEVVHGKGTMVNKMWGDYYQKFAQLRNLYTYQFAHPGKKLNFMGNEFGSFDEWDEKKSLPWMLKSYPAHDSITRLMRDLNLIYQHEKAMYMGEYEGYTFHWLMVDNASQSVFAFERVYKNTHLVFIFNMTPQYYENYKVGVNVPGTYHEIFNSDKDIYGGDNQYNGRPLKSNLYGPENRPQHINIKLASFGALIFKCNYRK